MSRFGARFEGFSGSKKEKNSVELGNNPDEERIQQINELSEKVTKLEKIYGFNNSQPEY